MDCNKESMIGLQKFPTIIFALRGTLKKPKGFKPCQGGKRMQATQTTSIQAKSLTILEDQLQHEFLACKKARFYAQQMQDAQLRGVASQIADAHCQRYDRLFNYLNAHA